MKHSELTNICNEIISMHIDDLNSEIPTIIRDNCDNSKPLEENLGALTAFLCANSIAHSVQAVTDVLVNVGLLELEDD